MGAAPGVVTGTLRDCANETRLAWTATGQPAVIVQRDPASKAASCPSEDANWATSSRVKCEFGGAKFTKSLAIPEPFQLDGRMATSREDQPQ